MSDYASLVNAIHAERIGAEEAMAEFAERMDTSVDSLYSDGLPEWSGVDELEENAARFEAAERPVSAANCRRIAAEAQERIAMIESGELRIREPEAA